jgi:hypothetical protein
MYHISSRIYKNWGESMKKILITTIITISWTHMLIGCSSTHIITQKDELTINEKALNVKTNDERLEVKNLDVKGDSILATRYYDNRELILNISDVRKIVIYRKNDIKLGLIGAAGAAWGYFGTPDKPGDPFAQPGYWAVVLGGLGGAAGYFLGSNFESKETILFESNETSQKFNENVNN